MTQTAPQKDGRERRTVDRKPVNLPGRLIHDGGEESCVVYDISPQGAHVSASAAVPSEGPIRLKLTQHGEFIGKVAWRKQDRVGLEFFLLGEERIDLPVGAKSEPQWEAEPESAAAPDKPSLDSIMERIRSMS